jgi:hypothetical protein
MRFRLAGVAIACVLAIFFAGLQLQPAAAGAVATSISLGLPGQVRTGQAMTVNAFLNSGYGPIPNASLKFNVAGRNATARTNGGGYARLRMRRNMAPGYYTVTVTYRGNGTFAPASASAGFTVLPLTGTSLRLILPPTSKAGQAIEISAVLDDPNGPMRRQPVHFYFNGVKKFTAETDASGTARYKLKRSFPAGVYTVTAYYHGTRPRGLAPISASGTLTIIPLHLTVQALPAIAGVSLSIDGQVHVTDATGAVKMDVASAGYHTFGAANTSADPNVKLRFVHWSTGSSDASIRYHLLADENVYASFSVLFLTHVKIVDADGHSLEGPNLGLVTASGPRGTNLQLWPSKGDQWLEIPPPSRSSLAGTPNDWHYSVSGATYQGLSVANRGDSSFVPGPGKTWVVRLRLYTLSVHVRHPIVGTPHTSVLVISSNGIGRTAALDSNGNVQLKDLPRGDYTVKLVGPGYSLTVLTTMTRSQSIEVPAASPQEFFLGYWVIGLGLLLLVLLVRRRLRAQRRLGQ